jgi:sigma-B regulation protein RsbU (phosphoserine phosphatase)
MRTNTAASAASAVSAARVFIKVLCVIFAAEAAVMFVLPVILPRTFPEEVRGIVDAFLLTVVSAPLLWWIIIEPILKEQGVRRRAELLLSQTEAKLHIAAEIQNKLLPKSKPVLPGTDIAAKLAAAESTCGDFYDFPSMPDGSVGIVIADVSGHGIDSALLVASAGAYLRAVCQNSEDVGDILTRLNEFLVEQSQEGRFITLFLGRLDPTTMSFSYAAAGHRAYHFDSDETVNMLEATGPALGLVAGDTVPSSGIISLQPGQTLLLVTDGIEESANREGELFGSNRVIELIQSHQKLSSQETLDLLYREARGFAAGSPQLDDMTAIILKVLDT